MTRRLLPIICGLIAFHSASASPEYAWGGTHSLAMPEVGEKAARLLTPEIVELTLITTRPGDTSKPPVWNYVGDNFQLQLPAPDRFKVEVDGQRVEVRKPGSNAAPSTRL